MGDFVNSKPKEFFKDAIEKLSDRWRDVQKNDGKYVDDWFYNKYIK